MNTIKYLWNGDVALAWWEWCALGLAILCIFSILCLLIYLCVNEKTFLDGKSELEQRRCMAIVMSIFLLAGFTIFFFVLEITKRYNYTHTYLPIKERIQRIGEYEWLDVREEVRKIVSVECVGYGNAWEGRIYVAYSLVLDDESTCTERRDARIITQSDGRQYYEREGPAPQIGDSRRVLYGRRVNLQEYTIHDSEERIDVY